MVYIQYIMNIGTEDYTTVIKLTQDMTVLFKICVNCINTHSVESVHITLNELAIAGQQNWHN